MITWCTLLRFTYLFRMNQTYSDYKTRQAVYAVIQGSKQA